MSVCECAFTQVWSLTSVWELPATQTEHRMEVSRGEIRVVGGLEIKHCKALNAVLMMTRIR